jgi:hypothetical protein
MLLIELAQRRRSERDQILKMPTAILRLNEQITEEQDAIREQSIIEMNDTGDPQIRGFKDEKLVMRSQLKITALNDSKAQLEALIDEVETAFKDFGLPPMSMEDFDGMIRENQNLAHEFALKINRIARKLLGDNPALTLPELFSNEEILELEGKRGVAIIEGQKEAGRLIELKDRLIPLCKEASAIADDVFYPHRKAIRDPVRIAEMRSA